MARYIKRSRAKRIILRTICIITVLSVGIFALFELKARELVKNVVDNELEIQATHAIDTAVADTLGITEVSYDELVIVNKDSSGTISSLQTDSAAINTLKAELSLAITDRIKNDKRVTVGVPAGAFTGLVLLSDIGPDINVSLSLGGSVTTTIRSTFESAGINQTIHHIWLEVEADVSLTCPIIDYNTTFVSEFELCQTVIVGDIPQFFADRYRS